MLLLEYYFFLRNLNFKLSLKIDLVSSPLLFWFRDPFWTIQKVAQNQGHNIRQKRHNMKIWVMVWLCCNYYIKNKIYPFLRLKRWVRGKQNICVSHCHVSVINYLLFQFKIGASISPIWLKLSNVYPHKVFMQKMVLSLVLRDHGIGQIVTAENSCSICSVYSIVITPRVSGFEGTFKFSRFNNSQSSWNLHQVNTQSLTIPSDGELTGARWFSESSRKLITEFVKLLCCKCERKIKLDQGGF